MSARKRPVATGTPSAASSRTNASISGSACSGRGRRDPARPPAARGVAVERELAHDERGAAGVEQRPVHRAASSSNTRRFATFAASFAAHRRVVVVRHADEHAEARADLADDLAVDRDRALR